MTEITIFTLYFYLFTIYLCVLFFFFFFGGGGHLLAFTLHGSVVLFHKPVIFFLFKYVIDLFFKYVISLSLIITCLDDSISVLAYFPVNGICSCQFAGIYNSLPLTLYTKA